MGSRTRGLGHGSWVSLGFGSSIGAGPRGGPDGRASARADRRQSPGLERRRSDLADRGTCRAPRGAPSEPGRARKGAASFREYPAPGPGPAAPGAKRSQSPAERSQSPGADRSQSPAADEPGRAPPVRRGASARRDGAGMPGPSSRPRPDCQRAPDIIVFRRPGVLRIRGGVRSRSPGPVGPGRGSRPQTDPRPGHDRRAVVSTTVVVESDGIRLLLVLRARPSRGRFCDPRLRLAAHASAGRGGGGVLRGDAASPGRRPRTRPRLRARRVCLLDRRARLRRRRVSRQVGLRGSDWRFCPCSGPSTTGCRRFLALRGVDSATDVILRDADDLRAGGDIRAASTAGARRSGLWAYRLPRRLSFPGAASGSTPGLPSPP